MPLSGEIVGPNCHTQVDQNDIDFSERARHREIAAYLSAASIHPEVCIGLSPSPCLPPDIALTALVQNGALRLDTDRAFLSLIDGEFQYVCAEATRSVSLVDSNAVKAQESLYLGVCKLPLNFGVCPNTMKVFTDETNTWVANGPNVIANRSRYIINDFQCDPHYASKPYVSGFPHMRSYLEVPLVTTLGYVLGSYCVVDTRLRPEFNTEPVIEIMSHIASAIMAHLDLVKTKQVRGRSEQLIKGLGEFMERESNVRHSTRSFSITDSTRSTRVASLSSDASTFSEVPGASLVSSPSEPPLSARDAHSGLSPSSQTYPSPSTGGIATNEGSEFPFSPFGEGKDLTPPSTPPQLSDDDHLDQNSTIAESTGPTKTDNLATTEAYSQIADQPEIGASSTSTSSGVGTEFHTSPISGEVRDTFAKAAATIREAMTLDALCFIDAVPSGFGSRSVHGAPLEQGDDPSASDTADSGRERTPEIYCATLSQSVNRERHSRKGGPVAPRKQLPEAILQRFIRRYPSGHIFTADERGPIDCSYGPGHNMKSSPKSHHRSARATEDVAELFAFLPDARYVIFLPTWHFQRECWFAAAFGWVCDATLAIELADLNLLTAFGNSVMVEVSRYEALAVSRAKSDFISSISHELRSPLHGIMASGELLRDAIEDSQLLPMLDMIDSCSTTLLDTFDNLLDFAKINSAVKVVDKSESSARRKQKAAVNLTDLSRLVEDVVETVQLGHTSKTAFHASPEREGIFATMAALSNADEDLPDSSVLVTLNIEKRASWMTKLDVGAWKRIVMNIFGNALKYTRSGHIEVGLGMTQIPGIKNQSRSHICFSVTDTGIGMSPDYLKYHLFTPFAQENTLSPGTGLGLSIVQQIAKTLGGDIDVKSQIGVGTVVKVLVPLNGGLAGPLALQLAPIVEGSQPDAHHDLKGHSLCCITPEAYQVLSNSEFEMTSELRDRTRPVRRALKHIAEDFLGMKVIFATREIPIPDADIYFFDSYNLGRTMGKSNTKLPDWLLKLTPLVVLCSGPNPLRHLKDTGGCKYLRFRQPIGTKKLATVLLQALNAGRSDPPFQSGPTSRTLKAWKTLSDEIPTNPACFTTRSKEEARLHVSALSSDTLSPNCIPSALSVPTPPSSVEMPSGSLPSPEFLHLLLVDDNPINLKILTTLVKKLGHTFATASNGLESVHLFKASLHSSQRLFDVVFMDISMPVMNGFEATREIRKVERENGMDESSSSNRGATTDGCQIVALTGLGSESSRQEAFSSGTNLFLTKPVKLAEIKKVLSERRLSKHDRMRSESKVFFADEVEGVGV